MKTIFATFVLFVFGCLPLFSQVPDTSAVSSKLPAKKDLVAKPQADSTASKALVFSNGSKQKLFNFPGRQEAPNSLRANGVQPVPMPTAKLDNRKNFPMPVAKPDSTIDFKLRVKKIR